MMGNAGAVAGQDVTRRRPVARQIGWLAGVSALALACGGAAFAQTAPVQTIRADRDVRGTLASGDAVLTMDNSFYDTFSLDVREGQRVRVRMQSSDFTPYLVVGAPVDEDCDGCEIGIAEGGVAEVTWRATRSGPVQIRANSRNGGETGRYTVRADLEDMLTGPASQTIRFGTPVDSSLSTRDFVNEEGQFERAYDVRLRAGRPVRVAVSGLSALDPVIKVMAPDGTMVGEDDDGGPGLDSRVDFTPTRAGTYRVLVASLSQGQGGPVTVLVSEPPKTQPTQITDLVAGQPAPGRIDDSSQLVEVNGDPIRAGMFQFPITADTVYIVEATAAEFDTALEVQQRNGDQVVDTTGDDDSGGDFNPRVRFRAQTTGTARVMVTAVSGTGEYAVQYREYVPVQAPESGVPVTVGASVAGELNAQSPMRQVEGDPDNEVPFAPYQIELAAGQAITVRVNRTSEDSQFDPLVQIGTGTPRAFTKIAEDDDSGSGLNARLNFTADTAGTYVILVSSFGSTTGADYRLEVMNQRLPQIQVTPLTLGNEVSGTLAANDRTVIGDDDGSLGRMFSFQATAGQHYVIEAASTGFDTTLTVSRDAAGIYERTDDDDGGAGTNSRAVIKAETSGTYHVLLESFDGQTGGPFTIKVETGTAESADQPDPDDGPVVEVPVPSPRN